MKKSVFLSVLLLSLITVSCNKGNIHHEDDKDLDPIGDKTVSTLKEEEYKKLPQYVVSRLSTYDSYKAITKGSTAATVLFIETVQSIDASVIKGKDYSYYKNESHSNILNTSHIAYYHKEEAVYKNNGESKYHLVTMEEYLNKYGISPFVNALEGYSVSEEAILEVNKLESESDYKFLVKFDPSKATNNVRIQMKVFGQLDDYPSFSSIQMTLSIKDNFTLNSIELESRYKATKMMESNCHQKYTVNFSNYNESIQIEGLEEAKEYFSK